MAGKRRFIAARRHGGNNLPGLNEVRGLVMVGGEFGDGAESAEAPLRLGIGNFPAQQIDGSDRFRAWIGIPPGLHPGEYRAVM